jgi:hypothetical protein
VSDKVIKQTKKYSQNNDRKKEKKQYKYLHNINHLFYILPGNIADNSGIKWG